MSKSKGNSEKARAIGNYTKDAVKTFENNIVTKHNYLETVEKDLNNKFN